MAEHVFGKGEGIGMTGNVSQSEENMTDRPAAWPKKKVLILANHDLVIYNFRLELVERLLAEGHQVHLSSPYGSRIDDLTAIGAQYHQTDMDRHGMNPAKELLLLARYRRLFRDIRPDIVLAFTVKPDIYGGMAAGAAHIPFIANITGLGTALENGGIKKAFVLFLYRIGLLHAHRVFFQNRENLNFMLEHHVVTGPYSLLPGSGVNLSRHSYEEYPEVSQELVFITAGRIMKDKGTDELLEAAQAIKRKHPKVRFCLIGFFDGDYRRKIAQAVRKGTVEYIGQKKDIHPYIRDAHAVIHPSHHEGMSNVLLEAASAGRPVLASNIPGCQEAFDEGISGFGFPAGDSAALAEVIERFIALTARQKADMGKAGRRKMEREFDRKIVVEAYMKEIENSSHIEK